MDSVIFIANQLSKYFNKESLVKVGVCTVFIKDMKTEYSFGGNIIYDNTDVIVFAGMPKRIEIDGENVCTLLDYQHNDFLSYIMNLKQNSECKFHEKYFIYSGKKYNDIEDVKLILSKK